MILKNSEFFFFFVYFLWSSVQAGEVYDVRNQVCCLGKTWPHPPNTYLQCCSDSAYDVTKSICCSGVLHPLRSGRSRTLCCDEEAYDAISHICCDGQVHELPFWVDEATIPFLSCCGNTVHDTRDTKCCGGRLHAILNGTSKHECCNNILYEPEMEMCCSGNIFEVEIYRHCCADQIYDDSNQLCCQANQIINKTSPDDRCCGGSSYNPTNQLCCENSTNLAILPRSTFTTKCCGAATYDLSRQICCHGVVYNVSSFHHECCRFEPMHPNEEICCNNTIRPKTFGIATECCGNSGVFNRWNQLCCQDQVFERNGDEQFCCGPRPFNSSTHTCCDLGRNGVSHRVLPKTVASEDCCNGRVYNRETHICCDGSVFQLAPNNPQFCCSSSFFNYLVP